ncbi:MAG: ATP-binding protein [Candidatus Binatia bacterium]|nr:ATP-binding protein [Candidatus Binatia bacterium]
MWGTLCVVLVSTCILAGTVGLWVVRQRLRELRDTIDGLSEAGAKTATGIIPTTSALFGDVERAVFALANRYHRRFAQAEEERALLAATLSSMHEGVLVLDAEGEVRLCNEEAQRCFGAGAPLVGKPLVAVARQPELVALVRQASATHSAAEAEIPLPNERVLQVRVAPVVRPTASEMLLLVVARDVTETKRLEMARRDFIANVSHELRTPLTSIRGYAETLLAGALQNREQTRAFLTVIERHAERLSRLVDDLLVLSNLELGKAPLQMAAVNAVDLVSRLLEELAPLARAKNIELRAELPSYLPALIGDADRVEQVLVNLVDNAIKYTPEGGSVSVRATPTNLACGTHLRPPNPEGSWIELCVADTGIGIPSRDLPRLTERFYRVDRARSRELGGTGLGLAIVKHILQAHGGALRIESTLGQGTRVYAYFPAEPVPVSPQAADSP